MPDDGIGNVACRMGTLCESEDDRCIYLQFSVQSFLVFSGYGAG